MGSLAVLVIRLSVARNRRFQGGPFADIAEPDPRGHIGRRWLVSVDEVSLYNDIDSHVGATEDVEPLHVVVDDDGA